MKNTFDILIIGGGAFGISSAIELAKRKFSIGLINPDSIPHHLAASTDISKVVRIEYGSDKEYCDMGAICIERWHEWNKILGENIYHEVGLTMLCREDFESEKQKFERSGMEYLTEHGYEFEKLNRKSLKEKFPAINSDQYEAACFNPRGGYAESGRAIEKLADYARSIGVEIHEGQTAHEFIFENNKAIGVKTREEKVFHAGHIIVAAGAHTPYLVPELRSYFKATGHPVFWLKPKNPELYTPPQLSVFTADTSNTGWYGFPLHPKYGVVKFGKHANGLELHPDQDDRKITDTEVADLRLFLKNAFPDLYDAPLVYTRRCLYTDTLDGHFWIDHHPKYKGLSVSSGGSGHGFKMMPLIGEITADMVEGKENQFSKRFKWRHLEKETKQEEEARFKEL